MSNVLSLQDRREIAFGNIRRMSRRRRRKLGRFLDMTIVDVHPDSELMEILRDLRQFCEVPGELQGTESYHEEKEA